MRQSIIKNIRRVFAQNGGSGGGGIVGSGTTNYIPKWTPDGFTLGNSQIFDNGTNVGVNEASPLSKLTTKGEILSTEDNISIFGLASSIRSLAVNGQAAVSTERGTNYARLTTDIVGNTLLFRSNGGSSFKIEDINGLENLRITSQNNAWQNFFVYRNNLEFLNNVSGLTALKLDSGGNVGIYQTSPTARLHAKGSDSTSSNYALKVDNSSSSPLLHVRNDGNVGIGTSLPTSKLQVVGLPTYANNAAAITGGLTAGAMYIRTGHGLDIVV